jgi:hypothetical protein
VGIVLKKKQLFFPFLKAYTRTCVFQKEFSKKKCPPQNKIPKKKGGNLFLIKKENKFSFTHGGKYFFVSPKKLFFSQQQKMVAKLSVIENGHFQFCPQIKIHIMTPPPIGGNPRRGGRGDKMFCLLLSPYFCIYLCQFDPKQLNSPEEMPFAHTYQYDPYSGSYLCTCKLSFENINEAKKHILDANEKPCKFFFFLFLFVLSFDCKKSII